MSWLRRLDWLNSVWPMTTVNPCIRNYDPKTNTLKEGHVASFPEEMPNRLVELYSVKGDVVLDPFCGAGTTNFIALSLFRKTIGYDIEEKYVNMAVERCGGRGAFYCKSSESMEEVPNNSVQLCVTSPPYMHLRKYSHNPENICNLKNPYPGLISVFQEVYRVLQYGGYFCLNVSNVPEESMSYLTTFPYDLIYICLEIGFKFKNSIIWDKGVTLKQWNVENKEIRENHEYIWVFRKSRHQNYTGRSSNNNDFFKRELIDKWGELKKELEKIAAKKSSLPT